MIIIAIYLSQSYRHSPDDVSSCVLFLPARDDDEPLSGSSFVHEITLSGERIIVSLPQIHRHEFVCL